MALLANRVRTRSHVAELLKLLWLGISKSLSIFLIIISLLFLSYNSSFVSSAALEIVGRTVDMGAIIFKSIFERTTFILDRFSYYKDLETENTRLRVELSKLQDAYTRNQINLKETQELKNILHVVEKFELPFITTKLLSVATTPFSSTAIIGAGSNEGVEIDDIVSSDAGLVGRIISVSPNYSTIRLPDDFNSRIPVITSDTKLRGILAKQDENLKIIYIDEKNPPKENEIVYTSGDGKIFPDELKIGIVKTVDSSGVIVSLNSDLKKLNYVYIHKVNK